MLTAAGISITYEHVPDVAIYGPAWARCDGIGSIRMPIEKDAFPNEDAAGEVLGRRTFCQALTVQTSIQNVRRTKRLVTLSANASTADM